MFVIIFCKFEILAEFSLFESLMLVSMILFCVLCLLFVFCWMYSICCFLIKIKCFMKIIFIINNIFDIIKLFRKIFNRPFTIPLAHSFYKIMNICFIFVKYQISQCFFCVPFWFCVFVLRHLFCGMICKHLVCLHSLWLLWVNLLRSAQLQLSNEFEITY